MQKVQRVKSSREVDMTNGKLLPKILKFALPLMFTGVLQLLFNAADMIVVGQFVGDIALAAVGATSNIVNLLVNLFMGLSIGAGVVMAKHYGAKNEDEAHDLVHTAMPLSLILGIAVLIIGLRLAKPMLVLLKTPDNCLPLSNQYLSIYFSLFLPSRHRVAMKISPICIRSSSVRRAGNLSPDISAQS